MPKTAEINLSQYYSDRQHVDMNQPNALTSTSGFIKHHIFPLTASTVIERDKIISIRYANGATFYYKLSHPIQFIQNGSEDLNDNEKEIIAALTAQLESDPTELAFHHHRLLPYTLYRLNSTDENIPPKFIVLSHEISVRPAKTKSAEVTDENVGYRYDILAPEAVYAPLVSAVDDDIIDQISGFKKYLIKNSYPKLASAFRSYKKDLITPDSIKKIAYIPENLTIVSIQSSLWRYRQRNQMIEIKAKKALVKSFFNSIKSDQINKEQIYNDMAYFDQTKDRNTVKTLTSRNAVTAILDGKTTLTKIHIPRIAGTSLDQIDFSALNYGEVLFIVTSCLFSLIDIYNKNGEGFVHGDLHRGNMIYNDQYDETTPRNRIVVPIDFGCSGKEGDQRVLLPMAGQNPRARYEKKLRALKDPKNKLYSHLTQEQTEAYKANLKANDPGYIFDNNNEESKEILSQNLDIKVLGEQFLKFFESSHKNKDFYNKSVHLAVLQMQSGEIKNCQQLEQVSRKFCIGLLQQLISDLSRLQKFLNDEIIHFEKLKSNYPNDSKKYKQFKVVIDSLNPTLAKVKDNHTSAVHLLNATISKTDEIIDSSQITALFDEVRKLQYQYNEAYKTIHQFVGEQKENSVLSSRRWGFRTILAVITRPLSMVLGAIELCVHSDVHNWYKQGFWFTRPTSWKEVNKSAESLDSMASSSQTLSSSTRKSMRG